MTAWKKINLTWKQALDYFIANFNAGAKFSRKVTLIKHGLCLVLTKNRLSAYEMKIK